MAARKKPTAKKARPKKVTRKKAPQLVKSPNVERRAQASDADTIKQISGTAKPIH